MYSLSDSICSAFTALERRRLLAYLALLPLAPPLGGCLFLARLLIGPRFASAAVRAGAAAPGLGRLASLGRPAAIAHSARLYPALQSGQSVAVLTRPPGSPSSASRLVGRTVRDGDLLILRNAQDAAVVASRKVQNNVRHHDKVNGIEVGVSKYNHRWDEASHHSDNHSKPIGHDHVLEDIVVHYDHKYNKLGQSTIVIDNNDDVGEILAPDELAADMEYYNNHPALCDPEVRRHFDKFREAQRECTQHHDSIACARQPVLLDNYQNALESAGKCR